MWKEFRRPDFAALPEPLIFDRRNMFPPELPKAAGLEYHAVGRLTAVARAELSLSERRLPQPSLPPRSEELARAPAEKRHVLNGVALP